MTESGRVKVRSRQADEEEEFVGGRLSKQILSEAKKQLQEINEEEEKAGPGAKAAKGATVLEPPKVRQDQFWRNGAIIMNTQCNPRSFSVGTSQK